MALKRAINELFENKTFSNNWIEITFFLILLTLFTLFILFFTQEEFRHWFIPRDRIVNSYVVEVRQNNTV